MDRKIFEECGRAFADGVAAALADHEKKSQKTPELIARKALLERMNDFAAFAATYKPYMSKDDIAESVLKQAKERALRLAEEAPTIEAAPVVHGEWREVDFEASVWACSQCNEPYVLIYGTPEENYYYFCPNCGAKMDGKAV